MQIAWLLFYAKCQHVRQAEIYSKIKECVLHISLNLLLHLYPVITKHLFMPPFYSPLYSSVFPEETRNLFLHLLDKVAILY